MVVNAAVQMIREAEELKQNILKFKSDTSMLQECSLWPSQQQLQKIYQKVLVLDLDYALDKKVEQDLWNVGFKQQIEALQAISKDRKNPLRSEAQAMLAWVLQAGAGFYLCLLHQICTAFKLDLPFRRRASLLGWVEGWSPSASSAAARLPPPAAARYICQHCLVHLGDLARYRQQPRVAYTFYRHALVVSTHSGQPYNQLALLARRRGRRLGALYWHVRAVLVRAPFPPAPANLRRTLQQHASGNTRPLPVLGGVRRAGPAPAAPMRLDAHGYVTEFMRALYLIHTLESLDFAASLVDTLNSSLTSLVATDSFESMTLIKMVCVIIWLVHSCTEGQTLEARALSESEARGAELAHELAAGALLALLAAATSAARSSQPAMKVCLQWVVLYPRLLETAPFARRPQLWHALAQALNDLHADNSDKYASVPLPEDEELHGFQPLERGMEELRFANHAAWDTYGRRVPDEEEGLPSSVVSPASLNEDPKLEAAVRAHRLIELGKRLAQLRPEEFTYTVEESAVRFVALCGGGEELAAARAAMAAAPAPAEPDDERDSDEDAPLPAPVVISEADFREKVRDKRVGILKPQGSLERAREERALATDDQEQDECSDDCRGEDRREARRPRVNIAMAAILRKQEETSKQVKFRTPPPVAEETDAETIAAETSLANPPAPHKPKSTLPRPQKSLADIPVGRKTGGILALKDKSGYPHLVNMAEDSTPRQTEKPAFKDPKVIQPPTHLPKRDAPAPKWHQPFEPRPAQRIYGLHSAGISYNPNYEAPATSMSSNIRLPVVNPKEIDVRSAALQKQNSRTDFQHRSANYTGDKKLFMDDLPPRFAQQRWSVEADNKFKISEEVKENKMNPDLFNAPPPSWLSPLSSQPQAQMSIPPPSQMSVLPPSQLSGPPHLSMPPPSLPQSQMSIPPPSQMSIPPPSLQDSYESWWNRTPMYGQLSSSQAQAQALQQLYGSQLSYNLSPYGQVSALDTMSPPSFLRQSPIGQLPTRHVSPPTYSPYPSLQYPSLFEAYPQYQGRGFLEPSTEALDLTMSPAALAVNYARARAEESSRIAEAGIDPAPLDLSRRDEPESDASAEDPGTYSLFSGATGAWGQVGQAQQGRGNPNV